MLRIPMTSKTARIGRRNDAGTSAAGDSITSTRVLAFDKVVHRSFFSGIFAMLRRAFSMAFCTTPALRGLALPCRCGHRHRPPRSAPQNQDATALHHLGDAVDRDHLFLDAVVAVLGDDTLRLHSCMCCPLELQTGFTRGIASAFTAMDR